MNFLAEYGLFLAKTVTLVAAFVFIVVVIVSNAARNRDDARDKGTLHVTKINEEFDKLRDDLRYQVLDEDVLKQEEKDEKHREKAAHKARRKAAKKHIVLEPERKRVYVLDFDGDTNASDVENLRHTITAVLSIARPEVDEVMLRLESPGGMVHAYGLAASQLARLRKHRIPLTICVDKVAASGGYMMACTANRLLAAPFAYIGSIGVLVQLPNVHRLLKQHNIDFEMITAGEYKRTLTTFGENTDKDREKVQEDVDEMHDLFKAFIHEYRPALDLAEVATGEVWTGAQSLSKGLIDGVETSDEWLVEQCKAADAYSVSWEHKRRLSDKLAALLEGSISKTLKKSVWDLLHRADKEKFYS